MFTTNPFFYYGAVYSNKCASSSALKTKPAYLSEQQKLFVCQPSFAYYLPPSFGSSRVKETQLKRDFRKAGYLSLEEGIQAVVRKENLYAKGYWSDIYQSPSLPKYLIKHLLPIPRYPGEIGPKPPSTSFVQFLQPDFRKQSFGQPIAKIGIPQLGEFLILPKVSGLPSGIRYDKTALNPGVINESLDLTETYFYDARKDYNNHLIRVSSLPQDAYNQFSKQMINLNKQAYVIDATVNNILIDEAKEKINVVNLRKMEWAQKHLGYVENNLAHFIAGILDNSYVDRERRILREKQDTKETLPNYPVKLTPFGIQPLSSEEDPVAVKLRQKILYKILIAALWTDLPIPDIPFDGGRWHQIMDPEYSFKLSGMEGKWQEVRNWLLESHKKGKKQKEDTLQKINQLFRINIR